MPRITLNEDLKLVLGTNVWMVSSQQGLDEQQAAEQVASTFAPHFKLPGLSGVIGCLKLAQKRYAEQVESSTPNAPSRKKIIKDATISDVVRMFKGIVLPWHETLAAQAEFAHELTKVASERTLIEQELERVRNRMAELQADLLSFDDADATEDHDVNAEDEDDGEVEDSAEEVEEEEVTVPESTSPKAKTKAAKK